MSKSIRNNAMLAVFVVVALLASACGPAIMVAAAGPRPTTPPAADKARVYFVAPVPPAPYRSGVAYIVDGSTLIGYIGNKQCFFTEMAPGQHIIMALAQNVSAVNANVAGGKTYYVRVDYAPGFSTNSVIMKPVIPGTKEWDERLAWVDGCRLYEYNPPGGAKYDARNSAKNAQRASDIQGGKGEALPLGPTDGD